MILIPRSLRSLAPKPRLQREAPAVLALCLALIAGCAAKPPIVIKEPKEVKVPVGKKCIPKEDAAQVKGAQFPLDAVDLSDPNTELARLANAARLELKVRREYVATVEKILEKCEE